MNRYPLEMLLLHHYKQKGVFVNGIIHVDLSSRMKYWKVTSPYSLNEAERYIMLFLKKHHMA